MSYNNGFRIAATGLSWPSLQPGGLNTYFQSICEQLTLERNTLDALICSDERTASTRPYSDSYDWQQAAIHLEAPGANAKICSRVVRQATDGYIVFPFCSL